MVSSAYMSFVRQSCFPIVGVGCAGMCDKDGCVLVDKLLPAEAVRIERLRILGKAVAQDAG